MSRSSRTRIRRDYYSGALMLLIGLGAVAEGRRYGIGVPTHMGPGFFPVTLGIILAVIGILIAASAMMSTDPGVRFLPEHPEWLGWACIVAAQIAFIAGGMYGGFLLATFSCVFIAAMGDRQTTFRQAIYLAAFISALGIVIFSYLLRIPFPIIKGIWE